MSKKTEVSLLPEEILMHKIFIIRNQKIMLDRDLALLYGIETKRLKEQVRRNMERFPEDFMFELTKKEFENWRSQFATSNQETMGLRYRPFAFTEHGVLMLSSVLNSDRAVKVNIQIMRIFSKMREMIASQKDLLLKMEILERKIGGQDEKIQAIFNHLRRLIQDQSKPRTRIGFVKDND